MDTGSGPHGQDQRQNSNADYQNYNQYGGHQTGKLLQRRSGILKAFVVQGNLKPLPIHILHFLYFCDDAFHVLRVFHRYIQFIKALHAGAIFIGNDRSKIGNNQILYFIKSHHTVVGVFQLTWSKQTHNFQFKILAGPDGIANFQAILFGQIFTDDNFSFVLRRNVPALSKDNLAGCKAGIFLTLPNANNVSGIFEFFVHRQRAFK